MHATPNFITQVSCVSVQLNNLKIFEIHGHTNELPYKTTNVPDVN